MIRAAATLTRGSPAPTPASRCAGQSGRMFSRVAPAVTTPARARPMVRRRCATVARIPPRRAPTFVSLAFECAGAAAVHVVRYVRGIVE